ncbi:MAG TPA: hypothetical protein VNZ64_25870 [Candidatus Acidoferrum sp.]|jgi:hypothetical protein|nr:hypothetical protein [Candidatus Acidoferrum sp.]
MRLVKLIEFLRNRLKTVVRVCFGVLALLILCDALFVSKESAHTSTEHIPGFWSLFGFIGCALIIILSKWYGHVGIMTREDYYDDPSPSPAPEASRHG